ncbi:MAG: hypothetical protein RB292_01965 [Patescibacteria group bacterium]|jgi:tetratricopeptide (TPR) repeat protein|nr:hypothetical protein [Patescibacteria group bacterium]
MSLYLIPLTVIIISLGGIIYIIVKNFSALAVIKVETISKERENVVRNRIMIDRLYRKFVSFSRFIREVSRPFAQKINDAWTDFYNRAMELEKETIKNATPLKKIDLQQQIVQKLEDIDKLIAEEELDEAEEESINIIELDPGNLDAYDLLGRIYTLKKDYRKARETLRYLLKLLTNLSRKSDAGEDKHRLANCYSDLGWVYQLENKPKQALTSFEKSVELEPNNPRFLDLLLKISIILKNKKSAEEAFEKLRQADPDNQKLEALAEEISKIEG